MRPRVLLVDDDPNILSGHRRSLRKHFEVVTNEKPAEALADLEAAGPFAVVVSDYRMPEMDGVTFLSNVRQLSPDTVRIMLTGQAGLDATIEAINRSDVFRFLTKPCPPESLISTIEAAAEHYRLLNAEPELLDGTLQQIVRVLIELIGLVDPALQQASSDLQELVAGMCARLGLDGSWEYELAAQVSHLGTIALPATIVERRRTGQALSATDQQIYDSHPQSAYNLLVQIPRLGRVARMVLAQQRPPGSRPLNPSAPDEDDVVAIGAHLLSIAASYQSLLAQQKTPNNAITHLRRLPGPPFRSDALDSLATNTESVSSMVQADLRVDDLTPGIVLDEAVQSTAGLMLLAAGHNLTNANIEKIRRYAETSGIVEPIRVLIPTDQ